MDEEGIENCKKGWKNLEEHRPKHRAKYCGKPKRKVVAVFDDGEWSDFDDIHSAGFCLAYVKRMLDVAVS